MPASAAPSANESAAGFVAAIKAHENFVLRRPGGQRADLRFLNAPGINLSQRRLDEIELTGAELPGVNLADANLDRASLSCANITKGNLTRASLIRADLRGARIQGASFEFAQMDGIDFRQSTIMVTDTSENWKVLGRGQNFSTSVSFANCSLRGAKMNNANLKDAVFDGALLHGASFGGATLGNATFDGAVLTGVNLSELRLPKDRFKNCVTDPGPELQGRLPRLLAMLLDAERWAQSGGREGSHANLENEDIRLLAKSMQKRKLTGIKCAKTVAVEADFTACELQAANFDGADLRGATFAGADLRGASFRGANLAHASFAGANLLPLQLNSGVALPVNFGEARLDCVNFAGAQRA